MWLVAAVGLLVVLAWPSPALTRASTVGPSRLVSTEPAPDGVDGWDETYALRVGLTDRTYRVFVPSGLGSRASRVLVMMHPLGATPLALEKATALDRGAVRTGTVIAYPAGVGKSWNAGSCCGTAHDQNVNDVAFIDAVITDVTTRYPVDPAKIAVGGFSNGGLMTYRYMCERSARVHTFVVASGVPVAPFCSLPAGVSLLDMHGMADLIVPWLGTSSSSYSAAGFPAVLPAVSGIAKRDGCTGWTLSKLSSGATRRQATGCPSGRSVDLITSPTLGHFWATGAASKVFKIDETGTTWSFLLRH